MNDRDSIILCQPDDRKSCSACCGLFNFTDISRENLSGFLARGASRSSSLIAAGDNTDQGDGREIRDRTSYICPHQGFIFSGRPGCLIHPRLGEGSMRKNAFFGEKICSGFLCPAHSVLSAMQKTIIIEFIDDWYLYSVSIIDPESTAWLLEYLEARYAPAFERKEIITKILADCLAIHAARMARCPGPIFYYSLSEFENARNKFSLKSDTREAMEERNEMVAAIERGL